MCSSKIVKLPIIQFRLVVHLYRIKLGRRHRQFYDFIYFLSFSADRILARPPITSYSSFSRAHPWPDISYELYVCRLGQNNKRQNKRMALIFFITSLSPPDFKSSREFSSQYLALAADRSSSSHHRQPLDFCILQPSLAAVRCPPSVVVVGPKYRTRLGRSSSSIYL